MMDNNEREQQEHIAFRRESTRDYLWHTWLNTWVHERFQTGAPPFPRPDDAQALYPWKSLLHFLRHGWRSLQQAFEGTLPQTYTHCSHSPPEALPEPNTVRCVLGETVTACPILRDFHAHWQQEAALTWAEGPDAGALMYPEVTPEDLYRTMSEICGWHMLTQILRAERRGSFLDYTEGFMQDGTDRLFWQRTYASMAGSDTEEA